MLFIELYARILAKFRSKKAFCQLCGISPQTLNNYLSGRRAMSADFISKASELLGLSLEEIGLYFFEPIVAKEHDAAV